eukprot:COSAG06_NODE_3552_length_5197_cov_15.188309_1_plen_52_part_10
MEAFFSPMTILLMCFCMYMPSYKPTLACLSIFSCTSCRWALHDWFTRWDSRV